MRVLLLAYRLHDLFLAADVGVVDLDHMLPGWLVASLGRLPNPFVASRGPGVASRGWAWLPRSRLPPFHVHRNLPLARIEALKTPRRLSPHDGRRVEQRPAHFGVQVAPELERRGRRGR